MNKVITELQNIDYKHYFDLIKRRDIKRGASLTTADNYHNIFGEYLGYDEDLNALYKGSYTFGVNPSNVFHVSNGIEVMKLKPHTTTTGKRTIKGWTITDLKRFLKINGFKGYSKLKQDEIIDLLIKM